MKKRLLLEIIVGIVLFGLGVLLGFHLFYQGGCPKCPAKTNSYEKTYTGEELIKQYNITAKANSGIKQRGYTVDWKGTYYLVTIAMGEKRTGGYYITVDSVTETDGAVEIVIIENSPGISDTVTQAFTTPAVTLQVHSNNVTVKTVNGSSLPLIK